MRGCKKSGPEPKRKNFQKSPSDMEKHLAFGESPKLPGGVNQARVNTQQYGK